MMLIYIPAPSPRLHYVFDFVLRETLATEYEFTSNLDFYNSSDNRFKWSYGQELNNTPSLPAAAILWQTNIDHQPCAKLVREDIIPIFETEAYGEINFDVLASIFYLISRYEEYLPCVKDKHDRYAAIQSIAYQYGFLETAMVNRYILWLARWLRSHFPALDIRIPKPKALLTVDIDHPFYTKDVSLGKWIKRSLKELSFLSETDKYDTTDFILETLGELASIFFILCPKNPSDMDHFNQRDSSAFIDLIKKLKAKTKMGLHPSYFSEERGLLEEELLWLSSYHERPLKSTRFHYLRFDIETTPGLLMKSGIQNDFSLGYGTHAGFRTSCSLPFYLFDLKKNRKTNLKIYTPCIMDSVFKYGEVDNFDEKSNQLIEEVQNYGGVFIPIFHNDIVVDDIWQTHFKLCVDKMKQIN
jgi:hypothetical protein